MQKVGTILGSIRRLGQPGRPGQKKYSTLSALVSYRPPFLKGVLKAVFLTFLGTNHCEYVFDTLRHIFLPSQT